MRKKLIYCYLLAMAPLWLLAQNPNGNYNPYVNSGTISPSPFLPVEADGKGTVLFNLGNSGSDPLEVFGDQHIMLTITLSYGEPDQADPLIAVGGTAADLFTWRYNNKTFTAKQISDIPAGYEGSIEIAYRVINNSPSPGINGFNVNIAPAAYQTGSNLQNDDAVSSYTYTESVDYVDAPIVPEKLSVYPNPSRGDFTLSLSGAKGDFTIEIISPIGNIMMQRIIQMNEQLPEVLISVPDLPTGLYNIRMYRDDSVYFGKLMIIQ